MEDDGYDVAAEDRVGRIPAWSPVLPVLCAWAFLSAMSGFSMWGGGHTVLSFSIVAVMLLFGLWPIVALLCVGAVLRVE